MIKKWESLPARGAWIEIGSSASTPDSHLGRSPRGERGLKYHSRECSASRLPSLPARGAWIEISALFLRLFSGAWIEIASASVRIATTRPRSLPARGAWIEIIQANSTDFPVPGRSPRGERGLKLFLTNYKYLEAWSLPARGAWIEISRRRCWPSAKPSSLPARGAWIEMRSSYPVLHRI